MFKCLTIVLYIIVWFVLYSYDSVTHINYCLLVINPELVWLQCWCSIKFLWMWYDDIVLPLRFHYAFVTLTLCFRYASVMLRLCLCDAYVMLLLCLSHASVMLLLCCCRCFIVLLLCFHWNKILTQSLSNFFLIHIFLKKNT